MADKKLPFFVYGTLRPGNRLWLQYIGDTQETSVKGILKGYALSFAKSSKTYPTITPRPGDVVYGDILYIKPEHYEGIKRNINWLEVTASGYKKEIVDIETPNGIVTALTYVAHERYSLFDEEDIIESGDWNKTRESKIGRAK